ncbi:MAG: putative DNA binding domain-containing protein [Thermoguttaceae bacterium]|nr:putative DNA binding domain-containing protein [Thermoguttaceae bacterium]
METRESETVEFKKSTSELKEGVVSLASMLNKNGWGILYFGVKNDGTIVGQQIGQKTTSDISKAIKLFLKPRITPKIELTTEEDKEIVKITVRGEDRPYSAYDRYYVRSDDEDLIMTAQQLEDYFLNRNYSYSEWEKADSGASLDDVDEELLIRYVQKGNDCGRISFVYKDAQSTLRRLKLLNGDHLNNAGNCLFSNQKPLLLKLASYPTDERITFTDLKQFRGNIFECVDEAVKFVGDNIRWSARIIGMERVETPEIPLEAFREIILNSFAHMRVDETSSNEIYITPTKVHIYNPGGLVPGTTPEMFANREQGSMLRNPLIANVLYCNKSIDAFGTGFERVFQLCKNTEYLYNNNQFGFTFEFLRLSVDSYNESIVHPENLLTEYEKQILDIIKSKRKLTRDEMAREIGKSKATIQRNIKNLINKGYIKRVGSNKTGFWVVR